MNMGGCSWEVGTQMAERKLKISSVQCVTWKRINEAQRANQFAQKKLRANLNQIFVILANIK